MKKAIVVLAMCTCIAILLFLGKKHISTEITINAPAQKVWNVLTDFNSYPAWNPFIIKATGVIEEGKTIEVTFKTEGSKPVTFTPKIIRLKQNSVLQWEGKLLMPGLFTGRHTFELVPAGAATTRLIQKEDFNGILVPFFNYDSTVAGFTAMNKRLKGRCEKN